MARARAGRQTGRLNGPLRGPASSSLLGSGVLTLAGRIGNFALSIAAAIVLARTLGPAGRGLYALAVAGPGVFVLIANLGVGNALVYHLARNTFPVDRLIGQLISMASILGIASLALFIALAYLFGTAVFPGVPFHLLLIASAAIPLSLFFYFCLSFCQGALRFGAYNLLYLVNGAGQVLFFTALFVRPGEATVAVTAWTLSSVPTAIVGAFVLAQSGRLGWSFDIDIAKKLLGFGSVGYVSFLVNYLNFRLDTVLVNIFKAATQVGLYAVAVSLAETIWYVSTSAATVLAPRVAAAAEDSDQTTARVSRIVLAASVVAALALAMAAQPIIRIVLGPSFLPSVIAIWLLMPGIVTLSVARVLSSYLLGRNRQQVDLVASLSGVVITVGLDLILIPGYGFAGAAVASSVAYTTTLAVNLTWVVRNSTLSVADLLLPRVSDFRYGARRLNALLHRA